MGLVLYFELSAVLFRWAPENLGRLFPATPSPLTMRTENHLGFSPWRSATFLFPLFFPLQFDISVVCRTYEYLRNQRENQKAASCLILPFFLQRNTKVGGFDEREGGKRRLGQVPVTGRSLAMRSWPNKSHPCVTESFETSLFWNRTRFPPLRKPVFRTTWLEKFKFSIYQLSRHWVEHLRLTAGRTLGTWTASRPPWFEIALVCGGFQFVWFVYFFCSRLD